MTRHPDVHAPWQEWSNDEVLHVACAYSNPFRWHTRRQLMNNFRAHMEGLPNVVLHVGELAYGRRPFEVTGQGSGARTQDSGFRIQDSGAESTGARATQEVQLRAKAELFHKENILNEVIETFPAGWKYGCIFDADFTHTRRDWALETIHQLQHYDFVQPFSNYSTLSAKKFGGARSTGTRKSFAATYIDNGYKLPPNLLSVAKYGEHQNVGATGGAWAFTRQAFDTVGGLLDQCILGHGDWFMAFGLVGVEERNMRSMAYHPHYVATIRQWQARAALLKKNIGVVDGFAVHHYHGSYKGRRYETRDKILVKYQFDPLADIRRNAQGVYELTGNKPDLRDAVRQYFLQRDEDNPNE